MNIFVDDKRRGLKDFAVVRTYDKAIKVITENKDNIDILSLDYDLGQPKNGMDIVKYLIDNKIYPKWINVHSTHVFSIEMIKLLMENIPQGYKLSRLEDYDLMIKVYNIE